MTFPHSRAPSTRSLTQRLPGWAARAAIALAVFELAPACSSGSSDGSDPTRVITTGTPDSGIAVVTTCGNGKVEGAEECDGTAFAGKTCATASSNTTPDGALGCTSACKLDLTACRSSNPASGGAPGAAGSPPGGAAGSSSGGVGGGSGAGGLVGAGGKMTSSGGSGSGGRNPFDCQSDPECDPGKLCIGHVCREPLPANSACSRPLDCAAGLKCLLAEPDHSFCTAPGPEGAYCVDSQWCQTGLLCKAGRCQNTATTCGSGCGPCQYFGGETCCYTCESGSCVQHCSF